MLQVEHYNAAIPIPFISVSRPSLSHYRIFFHSSCPSDTRSTTFSGFFFHHHPSPFTVAASNLAPDTRFSFRFARPPFAAGGHCNCRNLLRLSVRVQVPEDLLPLDYPWFYEISHISMF